MINEDKVLAQRELEERRYATTGIRMVSSRRTDPVEWGTQTPVPSENEDNNPQRRKKRRATRNKRSTCPYRENEDLVRLKMKEEESHEERACDAPRFPNSDDMAILATARGT